MLNRHVGNYALGNTNLKPLPRAPLALCCALIAACSGNALDENMPDMSPPQMGMAVSITPASAVVGAGKTFQFSATQPVNWSLPDGAASGTISEDGLYTAPLKTGSFSVLATSKLDARRTATAQVTVEAQLDLLTGKRGESGSTDRPAATARFFNPRGLAYDGGNLYIADFNHTVRKLVLATGEVTTIAGAAGMTGSADGIGAQARFNQPLGLEPDGAGNLYVTDLVNATIRKIVIATGAVSTIAGMAGMAGGTDGVGSAARFNEPYALALDRAAGAMYLTERVNHTVRKITLPGGSVSTLAGSAGVAGSTDGVGTAARFNQPRGVVLDSAGNLYIADAGSYTLRKLVLASATVSTIAGSAGMMGMVDGIGGAARFHDIRGLALDGAGAIFIAERTLGTVRRLVLATGAVSTVIGVAGQRGFVPGKLPTGLYGPVSLVITAPGALYLTDYDDHVLGVARGL